MIFLLAFKWQITISRFSAYHKNIAEIFKVEYFYYHIF
ncbi:MAG: hypothetical protein FMNOHCHN_02500 [Ignavibacteriaceae bacterium]|nr:hypothetical protein [Ignavibacteriaceae bacterium]